MRNVYNWHKSKNETWQKERDSKIVNRNNIILKKKKINEKSKKICFCSSTSFAWDMIMMNGKEFFFKDNINLQ